jgi:PEP-CTERM motif-containing protein
MKSLSVCWSVFSALLLALVMAVPVARADVIFSLDTVINGVSPTGSPPWLTATFHENSVGDVTLTLNNLMAPAQFVDTVVFNSILNPTTLTFALLTSPPQLATPVTSATQSLNGGPNMKAGLFNVEFDYATAAASRFTGGTSSIWHITGAGLTENNFLMTSIPELVGRNTFVGGGYYMAAHVQGIPDPLTGGTTSGSIGSTTPIPEPETYAMMLAGLGLMGFVARRRKQYGA